jgi:cytochrome o ubiquinol oxidase operon protein cyoD
MSAHHTHADHAHGHHGHDDHANHGSLKSYAIGFVLSVILTAIPFWLVMGKVIDKSSTAAIVVLGFAAVQVVVHMVYFLHMNTKVEGGWSMLAMVFTIVVVVIMLAGSIWVMYHLNHNMMPGMSDPTHEMHTSSGMQNSSHQMSDMP